jgi:phage replication O-like protein O
VANPQPDKFTKISNELMEAIPRYKFNGTQLRIIFVVVRYTYGFNRKDADLSLTFISKATGSHKEQVKRELNALINSKVIKIVKGAGFNTTRILALNKNYDEWDIEKGELKNIQEANQITGSEKEQVQEANQITPTGSELDPQERHIKDNIKEKAHNNFESLWSLYPNKKGKGKISEAQIKKLYSIGIDELARCIDRYKQSKEEWKAWQQGSTFFNSGYIDYLDANYEEEPKEKTWGWS